jgi:hypothetical protein
MKLASKFGTQLPALLALATILSMLTACSVGMALSGEEQPDLTVLKTGATKTEIEAELGPPRTTVAATDGNSECIYHYEVGNEPSAGRAAVHAGMDILTLGLWEVMGTPMEAMQGDEMELTITYDADDKARSFDLKKLN